MSFLVLAILHLLQPVYIGSVSLHALRHLIHNARQDSNKDQREDLEAVHQMPPARAARDVRARVKYFRRRE